MNIEIANRLVQYRKKAGLSQEELADKLGVSRQAVSKWECAESSPDTDNLIALSKIYGVSLDELINGTEAPKQNKGIHIKGEDGEVIIDNPNVHLKDDEGNEVHIDNNGINIVENGKEKKINKEAVKREAIKSSLYGTFSLMVVIAYILIGCFVKDGWRNYWILFFLIPLFPSLIEAIRRKRFCVFAYPVLATMLFFLLGMFFNLWHPSWVLFISIPLYYSIFGPLDKYLDDKRRQKESSVIDNK